MVAAVAGTVQTRATPQISARNVFIVYIPLCLTAGEVDSENCASVRKSFICHSLSAAHEMKCKHVRQGRAGRAALVLLAARCRTRQVRRAGIVHFVTQKLPYGDRGD